MPELLLRRRRLSFDIAIFWALRALKLLANFLGKADQRLFLAVGPKGGITRVTVRDFGG